MDIEKIATETPDKVITKKLIIKRRSMEEEINEIISIFDFKEQLIEKGKQLIKILYKILIEKDASLIEINPLIITEDKNLICLDAKMNFDDNAIFRRPEVLKLRDLNEEELPRLKRVNMI